MHHSSTLCLAMLLAACGSDPLEASREALARGDNREAVTSLRQIVARTEHDPDADTMYEKALTAYVEELRGPDASKEACDGAVQQLSGIEGFPAAEGPNGATENGLITQAIICSARHRVQERQLDEAAKVLIDGTERLPSFEPGSTLLAKAMLDLAFRHARSGDVAEATALAQVIYSADQRDLAAAVLDALVDGGAGPSDVYQVLATRAEKAGTSDSAAGLAADFGLWHGYAQDAERLYDAVVVNAVKAANPDRDMMRYAHARAEEASRMSRFKTTPCEARTAGATVASAASILALDAIAVPGGVIVAWIEGESASLQRLKMTRVSLDGTAGQVTVVADPMLPAPPAKASNVWAPYSRKNKSVSLSLVRCGGIVEVTTRGAPNGGWSRATVDDTGSIVDPVALLPQPSAKIYMPTEDVNSTVGCSNDRVVQLWLADIRVLRAGWYAKGRPSGVVSDLNIPGFSPGFVAFGQEGGGTEVVWVDIMGEDLSQILSISLSKTGEVPLVDAPVEEGSEAPPAGQPEKVIDSMPVVEGIGARVEQIRLATVGDNFAILYYPRGGNIQAQFLDHAGRPTDASMLVAELRDDLRDPRFDADAAGERLGTVWTDALTDRWARLVFQSVGTDGGAYSPPQQVARFARPDITPVVIGSDGTFAVIWVDGTGEETDAVRLSFLHCGGAR
jgi:hypothetical protein